MPVLLFAMTAETDAGLIRGCAEGLRLSMHLVTAGAIDRAQVMNTACEAYQWRSAVRVFVACQAGVQLLLPAGKSGTPAKAQQFREALAAVGPGNMKTSRPVTRFASLFAVWRSGIRAVAMRACSNGLHLFAEMTGQAGLDAFRGKPGLSHCTDAVPGMLRQDATAY